MARTNPDIIPRKENLDTLFQTGHMTTPIPGKLPAFLGWAATVSNRSIVHLLIPNLDGSPGFRAACSGKVKMQQTILEYVPEPDLKCKACLEVRRNQEVIDRAMQKQQQSAPGQPSGDT